MCVHIHVCTKKMSELNHIVAREDRQTRDEKISLWTQRDLVQIRPLVLSSRMTLSKIISLCQFLHLQSEDGMDSTI